MDLETFHALEPAAAVEVLRPCADVAAWVASLVAGRPYADRSDLLAFAASEAAGWGPAEIDAALAQHPRIGERRAGADAEAALSRSEQAGVQQSAGDGDAAAIAAGNRAYEEKFGRIFLIRAAGRSSADVLEQLTTRLDNDPGTEDAVVAGQLAEIALLRLEGLIEP